MSENGLAQAAARFLEAEARYEAGRKNRKVAKGSRPRRVKAVAKVELQVLAPVAEVAVVDQATAYVDPFGWVAAHIRDPEPANQTPVEAVEEPDAEHASEAADEQVFTVPDVAVAEIAEPEPEFEAEPEPEVVDDAGLFEPVVAVAEPEPEIEPQFAGSGPGVEAEPEVIATEPEAEEPEPPATEPVHASAVCPDCDLPIEPDTDQCPHCALFLPQAA